MPVPVFHRPTRGCLSRSLGANGSVGRPLCLLLALATLLAMLVSVPGCGGCSQDPKAQAEAEKKRKEAELKKKKPKKDFEIGRLTVQPADRDQPLTFVKPGHWTSAMQEMKANNFDFVGRLEMAAVERESGEPVRLAGTPYQMYSVRPAALPKGQQKAFDLTLFIPHESRSVRMSSTLSGRGVGLTVSRSTELFAAMKPQEYFLVVFARLPNRYNYISTLESVSFPWHSATLDGKITHYRVVKVKPEKPVALPGTVLAWTSIAYLIWDDPPRDLLSPEQQQALVDWIHWGGQLIISGPESLESLRGTFLQPYLPAAAGERLTIGADDLAEINEYWTLPERRKPSPPLVAVTAWPAVRLEPVAGAQAIPKTGGLVVERPVGRGRIAATAFRISERDVVTWSGHDDFFNGCILRRPWRRHVEGAFGERTLTWADGYDPDNAELVTQVRFATRDSSEQGKCPKCGASYTVGVDLLCPSCQTDLRVGEKVEQLIKDKKQEEANAIVLGGDVDAMMVEAQSYKGVAAGGAACWNPYSSVSNVAREALRTAAGVTVPRAELVMLVLTVYVMLIAPLNWLLFWAIGKVEWAWVTAPLIALVCSVWVVRVAQLDIGFVRARTELAVLEAHGSYRRAHLTRYTALYSSLSSTYNLEFDTLDAVAQPFPVDEQFRMFPGQSVATVAYRRFDDVSLDDLRVASNTTSLVHCEQMLDLGGPIELNRDKEGHLRLLNSSRFKLDAVSLVRRAEEALQSCYVRELPAGRSTQVNLIATKPDRIDERLEAEVATTGERRFDVRALKTMLLDPRTLASGGARLVAQVNSVMPEMQVEPESSQTFGVTVVLVQLEPGRLPDPRPDANMPKDITTVTQETDD